MGVSENSGFYPPNHPILIGFSIIFTIHFGVPVFLETPISSRRKWQVGGLARIGLSRKSRVRERQLQALTSQEA